MLDACRNNPIKGENRGKIKGLASIDAPAGSLVMYSTKAGDVASDGSGKNSPFTTAFLQHITTPGLDVNLLPSKVTQTVMELTNDKQVPDSYVQITQSFTFVPAYTQEELDQIKKQQQSELSELQIKEAELNLQNQKEDDEMALKQAEIDALEQEIADMKNNTGGETDLDKMIEIIEQKEQQKIELEVMRKKAEEERIIREKEIADMKQQKFDENIAKYNKIANSEFGQDMKVTAWNSVLRNLGLTEGIVAVGDENALYMKFFDIPTQFIDQRDGKTYKVVAIENQVWMAENLAYKPNSGTYWAYDNDQSNVAKYGYLYDWETAKDVCPDGYHLPTDDEWKELETELGMTQIEADDTGYRGTNQGEQLKSETGWSSNGNGTNESGFNAFAGGYRYTFGSFGNVGSLGNWWSATPNGSSNAWYRRLYYGNARVKRTNYDRAYGFSVRCLRN